MRIIQPVSTDHLTTVADFSPNICSLKTGLPVSLLYFRIALAFDGEILSGEQRFKLKKCLNGAIKKFGGRAETIGFNGNRVSLLIGLSSNSVLTDFVERLKIFSRAVARRMLNAGKFVWNAKYEVSTVSFSQIESVSRDISRSECAPTIIAANHKFVPPDKIS